MLSQKKIRFGSGRRGGVRLRQLMIRLSMGVAPVLVATAAGSAALSHERLTEPNHAVAVPVPAVHEIRLMSAQTIVAVDGKSQVTVPDSWGMSPQNVWGKGETLQVADSAGHGNLMIAPQPNRGDFAAFTRNVRANLVNGKVFRTGHVSEDRPLSIAGRAAVQWELTTTHNGIDAVGWMTAIEGDSSYFLVFGWTSPDRAAADGDTIQNIILSFRELS
ncbi:hypothetical protein AB0H49_24700 [Nocardia sp. NPDC050713]|uniref:hypothetical protein n=1 Tax=Nocardia sp. NPDC050713 TaxID=3154511 RepID=UPI003409FB4D